MATLATAEVRVIADTSQFLRQLRRAIRGDMRQMTRDLNRQFNTELGRTGTQAGSEFRQRFNRHSGLEPRAARRMVRDWSDEILRQMTTTGERSGVVFQNGFRQSFRRIGFAALGQLAGRETGQSISQAIDREINRNLLRTGRNFSRGFSRTVIGPVIRSLAGLGTAMRSVTIVPLQAMGQLFSEFFTNLAEEFGQFLIRVAAIEAVSGALFIIPAAVAAAAAGIATMRVALSGMGQAFSAALGDAEEFEEAISDLAPAAQDAAREFRALRNDFRDIRLDVQQAAWEQLDGAITAVAQNLMGPVRQGMVAAAEEFGRFLRGIADFAAEAETAETVAAAFDAVREVFAGLAGAVQPFLRGVRAIADEFLPLADNMEERITAVGERFEQWAVQITESGRAMEAWRQAMGFLGGLRDLIVDIGFVFAAMFSAAEASGTGVIQVIHDLLGGLRQLAESPAGQEAIGEVFGALEQILRSLAPVLGRILGLLGDFAIAVGFIADAIGPSLLIFIDAIGDGIQALGEALIPFFENLGDALEVIAPAIAPAAEAFGNLLSALSPLLVLFGAFIRIVLEILTPVMNGLAAILGPVLSLLIDGLRELWELITIALRPAFEALQEVMEPLVEEILEAMGQVFLALGEALVPIAQMLPQLAEAFGQLAVIFIESMIPLIPVLTEMFIFFMEAGVIALIFTITHLLIPAFQVAVAAINIFINVIQFLINIFTTVRDAISTFIDVILTFGSSTTDTIGTVTDFIFNFGDVFQSTFGGMIDLIESAISSFNSLRTAASDAFNFITNNIPDLSDFSLGLGSLSPFANGGIVSSPTAALVGEAGREVIIPMSRPERAASLAQQSGLIDLLAARNAFPSNNDGGGRPIEMHVHSQSVNADLVAHKAVRKLTDAMVVT